MLMHQAVPAFAAWFGVTPKVTPQLRAELERAAWWLKAAPNL